MSSTEKDDEFAALLDEYEQSSGPAKKRDLPQPGQNVRGRVVSVGREAVFVEFGAKSEAILDIAEVTDESGQPTVRVGDTIEARVVEIRDNTPILRTTMGRGPTARAEIEQAFSTGLPVEGQVSAVIKGGVEVQVAGMRGFCPISQLDDRFVDNAEEFVGQRLQFRVIRYETGRGQANIVLSRKVLLEEEKAERASETRKRLQSGAVMSGVVTTLKPYGAFVDLGGIEGMIHVSEMSFARVEDPQELLHIGQEVEVQVLRVEKTDNPKRPEKVALSLKALAQDPWQEAADRWPEGSRTQGKVVRLQPYGAFVELQPGVEGLVHISQLGAGRRINHPREVVRVDEQIEVSILGIDLTQRRIALARVSEEAEADSQDRHDDYSEVDSPGVTYENANRSRGLGTFADLLKKR